MTCAKPQYYILPRGALRTRAYTDLDAAIRVAVRREPRPALAVVELHTTVTKAVAKRRGVRRRSRRDTSIS